MAKNRFAILHPIPAGENQPPIVACNEPFFTKSQPVTHFKRNSPNAFNVWFFSPDRIRIKSPGSALSFSAQIFKSSGDNIYQPMI
jgi:hypothetical protein